MAEIRKENGKQMADGKELDFSSVQKLSDDALENVDGGIKIHTKSHWYRSDSLVCGGCGSKSWTIIGAQEANDLQICCDKCGRIVWQKIDT